MQLAYKLPETYYFWHPNAIRVMKKNGGSRERQDLLYAAQSVIFYLHVFQYIYQFWFKINYFNTLRCLRHNGVITVVCVTTLQQCGNQVESQRENMNFYPKIKSRLYLNIQKT